MVHLSQVEPQTFWVKPTLHVPNSRLPVLVYRNALQDTSPEAIISAIESNKWLKCGQWKAYSVPHFHCKAHECYGIIRGSSTYLLGRSPLDPAIDDQGNRTGLLLHVQVGDVFVLPAGVSHCSLDSEGDYEIIGFSLQAPSSKRSSSDIHWGRATPEETILLAKEAARTLIPKFDPLYGVDGPLPRIWRRTPS